MKTDKIRLAILGCGNMGSAIALGLSKKSKAFAFYLFDPQIDKSRKLAVKTKGKAVKDFSQLKSCEYFLIACKPQQFPELSQDLKKVLSKDSKIISIQAGVSTRTISEKLVCKKMARIMPNTPCLINEGVSVIYFVNMTKKEQKVVGDIFSSIGQTYVVGSDDAIDKATALTGSGPAYFFEIARIFIEKAREWSFDSKNAEGMVKQLIKGSSLLMLQSKESPETLRNNVTSKGGTTEAALENLRAKNLEGSLKTALDAAYNRAKELSRS